MLFPRVKLMCIQIGLIVHNVTFITRVLQVFRYDTQFSYLVAVSQLEEVLI